MLLDSLHSLDKPTEIQAAYYTLGCKLNFAETSSLGDQLETMGISRAPKGVQAQICVLNTCSVTQTSHHKCRQALSRMCRQHPQALVVVMGCYAQLKPEEVAALKGVDLVISMEHKPQAARLIMEAYKKRQENGSALHIYNKVERKDIRSFMPSCSRGERTRYFLKVQDGCDYFCTYCTIPLARGRSRNASIQTLVEQATQAALKGGREIVITGVNIGDFGKSTSESFLELLESLDKIEGIERYRISSIEPNLLRTEIIDFCAQSPKFMPHFHIPLQSGSNEVLRLMHRRYDTALFQSRIDYIRQVMPDAFIGVDIIVGTRGETDELFEESFQFAQQIDVSQYHVFSYSERPNTMALRIPYAVEEKIKHLRSQRLIELSEEKRINFYRRFIGTQRTILTEHSHRGLSAKGFTDNYIKVEVPQTSTPQPSNVLLPYKLTGFNADKTALIGQPLL